MLHKEIYQMKDHKGGYIIFLCNQQDIVVPIQWQSKKVRRVVRSTLAAECLAQLDAVDASFLIKSLLEEVISCNNGIPVESIIDNKSLCEALYSTKCIEDKRLRVDVATLRERLHIGELSAVKWVDTSKQIANLFTKSGTSSTLLFDVIRSSKVHC